MRRLFLTLAFCATCMCACSQKIVKSAEWRDVVLQPQDTVVQPMTGLVLWPDEARSRNAQYGQTIQLEFSYCLPCKVVTGRADDGTILYDWSWFENLLADVAGRGHQLAVIPVPGKLVHNLRYQQTNLLIVPERTYRNAAKA